jgi:uncharacterized protein
MSNENEAYLDILSALRQLKLELQNEYPAIDSLGLFGSYIRNEQSPDSDVDILISFDFSRGKFSLFDYGDIQIRLSAWLGKPVDLVDKAGLKPRIGKHILDEVIEI